MEPLPAAPPARKTSKDESAPPATTPSGPAPSLPLGRARRSRPGRVPRVPGPRAVRSPSPSPAPSELPGPASLPGRRNLRSAQYLSRATPLFVGRRAGDLLPRRPCVLPPRGRLPLRVQCRRLRGNARPLAGGRGAYSRSRCRRTTFPTRGCVTRRHVPGRASVGRRPAARPNAPAAAASSQCRPEA